MEIKANELRIGNYLDFILPNSAVVVDQFYNDGYGDDIDDWFIDHHNIDNDEPCTNATRSIDDFSPIPLTEEWLLKFGLLKTKNISFLLGCYELVYSKGFDCWNVILKSGIAAKLKYVHQLQNLFFCLCGKELKYD